MSKNQSSQSFDWCVMHLFRYVPTSFVCATRHLHCDPLCNVPASALKLDSIFAASLPHLWRIFGCMFFFWVFCNITYPVFYSNSRSWPHLAAGGHSWFHRAPQFPHFPKCPSSKTSIGEHFYLVQIHDSFKNAPNTKTRFVRKCPYYKTLDSLSAPRKAKHCIAIGLWPWPGWALTWFAQGWFLGWLASAKPPG